MEKKSFSQKNFRPEMSKKIGRFRPGPDEEKLQKCPDETGRKTSKKFFFRKQGEQFTDRPKKF